VLSGTVHLAYFTTVQMLVYFDRAVLAGFITAIEDEFLNDDYHELDKNFYTGLLASGFMAGFIITSPIVALASGPRTAKVMGAGLAIWCAAALVACLAPTYEWLLLARMAAGAGEAAYCSLAPPMIDDTAPVNLKSVYLSIYFTTIFFGNALGFGLPASLDTWNEARYVFFLEALAMAPLVGFIFKYSDSFHCGSTDKEASAGAGGACLELQETQSGGLSGVLTDGQETSDTLATGIGPRQQSLIGEPSLPWWQQVSIVMQSRTYLLVMMGYSASMFSLGGFAWWVPKYIFDNFDITKQEADLALGGVTAASGIIGTVAGGFVLDYLTVTDAEANAEISRPGELGARGRAAVRVAYKCSLISLPFVLLACAEGVVWKFYASLATGQLFVFMSTAPVNVAIMESMPTNLRGLAMAITTTVTHCLGDVISPVFIGKVTDWCNGDLSLGMWILALWPIWSIFYWGWAAGDVARIRAARIPQRLRENISRLRGTRL